MTGAAVLCAPVVVIALYCLYGAWKEVLCVYRNPFPLFCGGDKRFRDIRKSPTRSMLRDLGRET